MCVSSPVHPVMIGNVRDARQMLPDPDWKVENQRGTRAMTNGGNNDDDNQGGDMPSLMFKEESNRGKTKNRDSKKKPVQIKKNDNRATQDVKEGTMKGKCFPRPCLTRAQAKKTDRIHLLKVEEAMSSVGKSTIEDLQKRDSTLKKCIAREGKLIIRENYVGEFFMKSGLLYRKQQETRTEEVQIS